ncbi:MAG: hypothetical protein GY771_03135, partial [bacterium]|nr:hypothetical protein [bacterium]
MKRKVLTDYVTFGVLLLGLFWAGCAGDDTTSNNETGGVSGEQYPFDTGGDALVVADTVEVYGSLYGTDAVHTLESGDRVTLIAEFDDAYRDSWRKIVYSENNVGWVKKADRSRFNLLYYIIYENTELYSFPGETDSVTATLPRGAEVEVKDVMIAGDDNWAAVRCERGEGWVMQSNLADGLLASCELSYFYGAEGKSKETLEYLEYAERAGAFVDYSNKSGPYAVRVPGLLFRVFGNGT